MLASRQPEPPDPSTLDVRRVLLASEGREIPPRAIEFAARIAGRSQAPVQVFSIARVHGTSFGFPNPGLLPTRHEWDEQRRLVTAAVKALKRHGLEASGHVVGTRKATKQDRKSTRLNSSHLVISYAVFCLKKKKKKEKYNTRSDYVTGTADC